MKQIPLHSRKHPGSFALVDDSDYEELSKFRWRMLRKANKRTGYAVRRFKDNDGNATMESMHRRILPPPPGRFVDHVDGDGLNNTRRNLRIATLTENNRNARKPRTNTSGFKGVTRHHRGVLWQAQIYFNNRNIYLGLFKTAVEAHAAYAEASRRLHGEFGRLE